MPTIKDIAREAGVSHGTVSNVINGRGNVSVEKIRLVWQAAEKLGYKVNAKAQSLRLGKDRAIAVMLPGIEYAHWAAMYEVFQSEFSQRGYSVQLYSTRSMESRELSLLTEALNARFSAIITSTCLTDALSHYRAEAPDLPLVFLQREGPEQPDVMYAGFDPERAGREIADYVCSQGAARIGVFTEAAELPDAALFIRGVRTRCQDKEAVNFLDCRNYQIGLRAFAFFDGGQAYDYMICSDRRREDAVRAACAYSSQAPLPRFVTLATKAAVTDPETSVYELDYKQLAHRIVKQLLARLEQGKALPGKLRMENDGFRTAQMVPGHLHSQTLRILTMASPSTTALARLAPHLEKTAGIHLELTVLPSLRDVYRVVQSPARSQYDLIRMDVAWLDELGEEVYRPLAQIPFDWDGLLAKAIPELGQHFTTAHGNRCCVPYDPSIQLLFYRRDLFTDPTYKRMYYEDFREELAVPKTFRDYNRVASFFTRGCNAASPTQYGSTVAIGNVVVSPSEFMPRLFAENGRLLDSQGRITLDTPEALRALENYRETYSYSDRTIYDFWKNALEGFADGTAAMTVVFINYASHILNSQMSRIAGKLGFAPVPGGKPLLGGGVIGIAQSCTCPAAACKFLEWLYADLVAPVFTMLGGLSPCRSAYSNRDISEQYPWLSTARKSFPTAQRRSNSTYYQNFSELQLETILAAHVQQAVLGVCSPEEALKQAQEDCNRYFQPW